MDRQLVRIASRESQLAVAQSRSVMDWLDHTGKVSTQLITLKTTGDKILDRTLDKVGGKGLFVKELDLALLDRRADLSVHSLKDVPMEISPELPLLAFSAREDPRDVLVLPVRQEENGGADAPQPGNGDSNRPEQGNGGVDAPQHIFTIEQILARLDPDKPIGSSSLRRVLQLRNIFPGVRVEPVRGNLQTRLRKLDDGQYSALVLAGAGLKRMGLESRINLYFSPDQMIPSGGQGILAVQGRAGEDHSYLDGYADRDATMAALCERAFVRELNGGCTSPVAAFAQISQNEILLRGLYQKPSTLEIFRERTSARCDSLQACEDLGRRLAQEMRKKYGE